ncbi:protein IQ-DOMAIN 9-like [Typha latifolia]|uniref:protein IQ-DOMAIN 9-like n=1 Tax=Typha latifolia TaxID=4733 RepID=UPI003C2F1760
MGSRDWFRTIVSKKKAKKDHSKLGKEPCSKESNESKWRSRAHKKFYKSYASAASNGNPGYSHMTIEDFAATRIQTAFRRFKARKALRCLKGVKRLHVLTQDYSVKKQASMTLSHIQSWSRIQGEIRSRRAFMVTEERNRQKKQENQLKLEAELHGLEVEWCGGSETIEEIIERIQHREEAAVKRERAMAYAFSHQWRASPGINLGPFIYEDGKRNWGWSWTERWIAARPWEPRIPANSMSPKKAQTGTASKVLRDTNQSALNLPSTVKPTLGDGKGSTKRSALPTNGKVVAGEPKLKVASSKLKKKELRGEPGAAVALADK